MGKKVTLTEIARTAGVSVATVSRILRGTARVSPELETNVRRSALKLGVNLSEQTGLRACGFLLSNRRVIHGFHGRVLLGAEDHIAAHDYNLLFVSLKYDTRLELQDVHMPAVLQRRNAVCGYVVAARVSPNVLEYLRRKGIAFAVLGNNVVGEWPDEQYDVVWFDDIQGTYELTRFLQSLGHRKICFVGHSGLRWSGRRYEGYLQAMTEAGLAPQLSEVDVDDYFEVGYMAAKSALGRGERFTAIVAASDLVAQGVYWALADCHLKVPTDVSVTGFDDIDAAFLHPPLTTVSVFPELIGKRLAEMLLNRVADPDMAPQRCMIPTRMVMRGSHSSPTNNALKEENEGREPVFSMVKTDEGSKASNSGQQDQRNPRVPAGSELNLIEFLQHRK